MGRWWARLHDELRKLFMKPPVMRRSGKLASRTASFSVPNRSAGRSFRWGIRSCVPNSVPGAGPRSASAPDLRGSHPLDLREQERGPPMESKTLRVEAETTGRETER